MTNLTAVLNGIPDGIPYDELRVAVEKADAAGNHKYVVMMSDGSYRYCRTEEQLKNHIEELEAKTKSMPTVNHQIAVVEI